MRILDNIEKDLAVSTGEMKAIIKRFQSEMAKGLAGKVSSLKMIPTFSEPATGNEKGAVLTIDLGGTNFRILKVVLNGCRKSSKPLIKQYELQAQHIKTKEAKFFDFICQCIKKFLKEENISLNKKLPLSFIFSFPLIQTSINAGTLIRWTKGFDVKGFIGKDVVKLFQEALFRNGLKFIEVNALANDTVGAMQAGRYKYPDCDMGIILGTGTNACYEESLPNIRTLKSNYIMMRSMIINMEWGNFDKLRRVPYDIMLDKASDNKGEQILEKMVSGKYLGEVARLILHDVFPKHKDFLEPYSFTAEDMSHIIVDNSKRLKQVKRVCDIVSTRAARIFTSVLTATITKNDPQLKKRHTVLIDGSVYRKYPGFADKTQKTIKEILKDKSKKINLTTEKDATGIGAAVIAAVAVNANRKL